MELYLTSEMLQISKECLEVLKEMNLNRSGVDIPNCSFQVRAHLTTGVPLLNKYGRKKINGNPKSHLAVELLDNLLRLCDAKNTISLQAWKDDVLIDSWDLPLTKVDAEVFMIAVQFFHLGSEFTSFFETMKNGESVEIIPT